MSSTDLWATHDWLSLSPSERHARTLVNLKRDVWRPDCTLETAIQSICEGAAWALGVERVSVWRYDADAGALNCLNSWDAIARTHTWNSMEEALNIDADAYMSMLQDVRTLSSVRSNSTAGLDNATKRQASRGLFFDFVHRTRVHAVIDAPACGGGVLYGAICHESRQVDRVWNREEEAFVASMGDFVAMAFEMSRRHDAESEVKRLQLHDTATGLGNRDYMLELITQRLTTPRDVDRPLAIIVLLVDSASITSSLHGPSAEDAMVRIASACRPLCGAGIELARVHSNGLAFLLTQAVEEGAAIHLAERCVGCIAALDWDNVASAPEIAVGFSFSSADTDEDSATLLRRAEEAAHGAQRPDGQGYDVFEPIHHDRLFENLRMERVLRNALANDQFEVYYQPEYDATSRQWVAAEALLRWNDGEVVHAACEFIEVAEASGLMIPLGKFALTKACQDASRWPPTSDGNALALRVNVSARQFASESLVEDIAFALSDSRLSPDRLCLEITETTLMVGIDAARVTLNTLRAMGIRLAIDDFGTGFASLIYLKRLPIDILKIDRTFVSGLPESRVDAAIVSAIVSLAGELGIDVIAEGVESIHQQDALTAIGVCRMQGWLYAKAMQQSSLLEILSAPLAQTDTRR